MKAKLPIRHPSGDIQLVVGSGILKLGMRSGLEIKILIVFLSHWPFFWPLNQQVSLLLSHRANFPQIFEWLGPSSHSDYISL